MVKKLDTGRGIIFQNWRYITSDRPICHIFEYSSLHGSTFDDEYTIETVFLTFSLQLNVAGISDGYSHKMENFTHKEKVFSKDKPISENRSSVAKWLTVNYASLITKLC